MSTTAQNTVVEQNAAVAVPQVTNEQAANVQPHARASSAAIPFNSNGAMLQALLSALQTVRDMMHSSNGLNILQMQTEMADVEQTYQSALSAAQNDKDKVTWEAYGQFASAGTAFVMGAASYGFSLREKYNNTTEKAQLTKVNALRDEYNRAKTRQPGRNAGNFNVDNLRNAGEARNAFDQSDAGLCRRALLDGDVRTATTARFLQRPNGELSSFEKAARVIESNAMDPNDRANLNAQFDTRIDALKQAIATKDTALQTLNSYFQLLNQMSSGMTDGSFKLIIAGYDYNAKVNSADAQKWEAARKFADDARQGFAQAVNSFTEDLRQINSTIQSLARV